MTSNAAVGGYIDRVIQSGTPLLGFLVWYSVAESTKSSHDDLVALLTDAGLDDFHPKRPTDKNIFMRTASKHARKNVDTADPGVYENYLIRKVRETTGSVTRHIVVERVDADNKKLVLGPTVQVEWTAPTTVDLKFLSRPDGTLHDNPQAMAVGELIRQDFINDRGMVNAYGIRELIRRIILSTGATLVRETGGVYFVMAPKAETIEQLRTLADGLPGVNIDPIPLVDDAQQRVMLRKAIEADTVGQIDKTLADFDDLPDMISVRQYGAITAEMNSLEKRTKEYAELLEDALAGCDLRLKVYKARVVKIYKEGRVGD